MDSTTYISITDICEGYQLERNYIIEMKEFGLIELNEETKEPQLNSLELAKLEKIVKFHRDLKINFEGIEVILNLLDKIEQQNNTLKNLRSRLHLYE